MGELSVWHWLIVIGVFVLLFGARKLPDAARSLGRSTRILKAELRANDAPASEVDGPAPVGTTAPEAPHVQAPAPAPQATVTPPVAEAPRA